MTAAGCVGQVSLACHAVPVAARLDLFSGPVRLMPAARDYWWGLPALLIGIVAMVAGDVEIVRAGANAGFFLLGFAAVLFLRRPRWNLRAVTGWVLCGVLVMSLFGAGNDGVHRWVAVGPLSVNVSMLVAPWLLAVVAHLVSSGRLPAGVALALVVQLAHLLQPDAAQSSAFAVGAVVLILFTDVGPPSRLALAGAGAVLVIAVATFTRRDALAPVAEVEGIVGLARDAAPALGVLAVVACLLLTVPFVLSALGGRRSDQSVRTAGYTAISAYVVVQLLAPIAVAVPVPVMGYGSATVLAYAAALSADMAMPRDRPPSDGRSDGKPRSPSSRSS